MLIKMQQSIEDRLEFINIYDEFSRWLEEIGFSFISSNTSADIVYKSYETKLGDTTMFGVECITIQELDLTIRFVRAHDVHKILIVDIYEVSVDLPINSITMNIDEAKEFILFLIKMSRDKKLKDLEPFMKL